MSQTHWKAILKKDSLYLGAWDLSDGDGGYTEHTLTIDHVTQEKVPGTDGTERVCPVGYFRENIKPMVLNKTNCKIIAKLYNEPHIEGWSGKSVTIYVNPKVRAFGETTEGLRVRPVVPQKQKPNLSPAHPKWVQAVNSLATGSVSMKWIHDNFAITSENEKLLLTEAENAKA